MESLKEKQKILSHYMIRNHNKFISIGIALSVMLIFSLVQIGESISQQYKSLLIGTCTYDIGIGSVSEQEEEMLMSYISTHEEIEEYGYEQDILDITIPRHPEYQYAFLTVYKEEHPFPAGDIILKEGTAPMGAFEAVIEEQLYETLGLAIGDTIELPMYENKKQSVACKVTGVYQLLNLPEDYGDSTFVLVSDETKKALKKKNVTLNKNTTAITITLDENQFNEAEVNKMQEELCVLLDKKYAAISEKLKKEEKLSTKEQEQYDSMQSKVILNDMKLEVLEKKNTGNLQFVMMIAMALIVAVAMVLLVYNSINLLVAKRIRDYSMLRCIGMNKKQLRKMLWGEMSLYALFGIVAGIVMGNLLNYLAANKIIFLITNQKSPLIQSAYSYLIAIVISVVAILIANVQVLIKVGEMSPVEGMHYIERTNIKAKKSSGKKKIKSMVSMIASRNLTRNLAKSVTVMISLVVCTVLFLVISNFAYAMKEVLSGEPVYKEDISKYETYINDAEITYQNTNPSAEKYIYSEDVYSAANADWKQYRFNDVSYSVVDAAKGDYSKWQGNLVLCDDALLQKMRSVMLELESINLQENILIYVSFQPYEIEENEINGKITKIENNCLIDDGGYVTLKCGIVDGSVEKEKKLKVSATLENFRLTEFEWGTSDRGYFIANESLIKKLYGTVGYNHILFDMEKGDADTKAIIKENYVSNIDGAVFNDYKMGDEADRQQIIGVACLLAYLVIATAMVGFSNMSNTIQANILSRKKENGVMRALGMSKKSQEKVIVLENRKLIHITVAISTILGFFINAIVMLVFFGEFKVYVIVYVVTALLLYLISYGVTKRAVYKSSQSMIVENLREAE